MQKPIVLVDKELIESLKASVDKLQSDVNQLQEESKKKKTDSSNWPLYLIVISIFVAMPLTSVFDDFRKTILIVTLWMCFVNACLDLYKATDSRKGWWSVSTRIFVAFAAIGTYAMVVTDLEKEKEKEENLSALTCAKVRQQCAGGGNP